MWSRFARNRFLKQHLQEEQRPFPAGLKKSIFIQAKDLILAHSRWIIGDGADIDFLRDIWIGDRSLLHLLKPGTNAANHSGISVRNMLTNHEHPLWNNITVNPDVLKIETSSEKDFCIWTGNSSGKFTSSSTYRMIANQGVRRNAWRNLWHITFLPRASLFTWKIIRRAVAVDSRVTDCGIQIVSKCACCRNPQTEDLNHLFIQSDIAVALWSWIAPLIRPNIHLHNQITIRCWNLISKSYTKSAVQFAGLYASILVVWEIWKARCATRYEGVAPYLRKI